MKEEEKLTRSGLEKGAFALAIVLGLVMFVLLLAYLFAGVNGMLREWGP